jgi:hypothetical protein
MDPVGFLVSFLVLIIVIAIVVLGVRWLLSVVGWNIPQPLLVILGLIFFLIVLLFFANYTGLYHPRFFTH